MRNVLIAAIAAMGLSASAAGAATLLTTADFDPGDTTVDIELAEGTPLTTQFPGLTFSGDAFGHSTSAAFLGDDLVGGNFGAGCVANPSGICGSFALDFDTSVTRFGGLFVTNASDDIIVTAFSGATNLGSVTFVTDLTATFFGIGDATGFDRLVFDPTTAENGAALFDNLVYGPGAAAVPVPLPAAMPLLLAGLGGLGLMGRRRRKAA